MTIGEQGEKGVTKKNADKTRHIQTLPQTTSSIKNAFVVMSSSEGVGKTSVVVN